MKVYILASKGKSLMSQPIKWRQWGFPFTHIALVVDLTNKNDPIVIEAWWNGARRGKFSEVHTPGTEFAIYSVRVSEHQKKKIFEFANSQIGKPYDWLGILGFVFFNPNLESKNRWFCSELVFAAFKQAGVELLKNTHPSEVSPRLLLKSPLLKLEYTAKLPEAKSSVSGSTAEGSTV